MKRSRKLLAPLLVLFVLVLLGGLAKGGTATVSASAIGTAQTDATQEKILVAIGASGGLPDSALYTLNPDGSGQTPLFDFHSHPKDTTGGIWHPRIEPGGGAVTFSSDNAYLFTPASRNLFRVGTDGSWETQITPGPNSGRWNQSCPCGVVTGIVRDGLGDPWAGRPVYLEGKDMVYSGADGRFRFDNVPTGTRWIMAYRALGEDVFDSQAVSVVAGLTADVALSPGSSYRAEFGRPVRFEDRVYHVLAPHIIQWSGVTYTPPVEVYRTSGACTGIPDIDGFDVAPTSGRLAIVNYQTGCGTGDTDHQGVYLADKDGKGVHLLMNMMADQNWCGAGEVFWSPDESRLAVKACYVQNGMWLTWLVVVDASNGAVLGSIYYPQTYTLYNVELHGWSPDGGWLLASSWVNDVSTGVLQKAPVNPNGTINDTGVVTLLSDTHISGATWGQLDPAAAASRIYLPMIIK